MIEIYALSYNGQPASAELRGVFGAEGGTFGRGNDNRLPLPDPARHVSRVQGRIRWDGARFWVANVSEANPMFLNDEEIESKKERPLATGDELRVGLYVLRVREPTGPAIDYRPPPAAARPAAPAAGAGAGSGAIDALLSGAQSVDNPFADILGGAAAAPPAAGIVAAEPAPRAPAAPEIRAAPASVDLGLGAPAAEPGANPFSDLLGPGGALPTAPPAQSASAPFADLLGGSPAAAGPPPTAAAQPFAGGGIPSDFDPFAAPAQAARRNSDDPLRDLANAGIDLAAVGNEPPKSLVDFDPTRKVDPNDAMRAGTPSLVDPLQAVDPMQLFGGAPDPLQAIPADVMPADAMPMNDGMPLIDAYFAPPRSLPDPSLPAVAPAVSAPGPAMPPPLPADAFAAPRELPADAFAAPPPPALPDVAPAVPPPAPVAERRPAPATPTVEAPAATPDLRAADAAQPPAPAAPPPSAPVRPAAARATPAAAGAPDPEAMKALFAAFLEGAHVPGFPLPHGMTPDAMRELGALVYQAVAGAMALIAARQITKREIGAELTMIVATRNNPLKFLPTPEAAMMQMLGPKMPGFMAAAESMADAFDDLRAHEVGVIAGTRAAFAEVLRRFDPKLLDERLGKGGVLQSLLPGSRHARLWELFAARYDELYRDAQDDFDSLYGLAFTQAYEEEVARNRHSRKPG